MPLLRQRVGNYGGWMPQNRRVLRSWLSKKLKKAGDPEENAPNWHSVIQDFRRLIEDNPETYKGFHEMFTQIPLDNANDPTGQPQVKDYMCMLNLFDTIIGEAPEWHFDPNDPQANDLVGFPINAILDWPMGTEAGYAMFISPIVNAQFKKMFDVWTKYLTSYPSTSVLNNSANGWFGATASQVIPDFPETYICNPDDPTGHMGFKSWDEFFTRLFRPGQREIPAELVDTDTVVFSACESAVYRVAYEVDFREQFWVKGQPYSLTHMLNNDPLAAQFAGGTVYQAFLSATKYHRWHSPVDGYIVKTILVPGTYYAESPTESFSDTDDNGNGADPAGPNLSQSFITSVAARAIIFIRAKNPQIGLMCFIAVGMAEVSTCEMVVQEGDYVVKGQEIGMFHFGGSTHCLVFRPETNIQIDSAYIPTEDNPNPSVLLKAPIAWVGEKPFKRHSEERSYLILTTMSSDDEAEIPNVQGKKRKVQRACDTCRRRKIRCDGLERLDSLCSNCAKFGNTKCTYEELPPSKRVRPTGKERIQQLEAQLERLKKLFRQLHPEIDLDTILQNDEPLQPRSSQARGEVLSQLIGVATELPEQLDEDLYNPDVHLSDDLRRLTVLDPDENFFFGKSSEVALLKTVIDLKHELNGLPKVERIKNPRIWSERRLKYWMPASWHFAPSTDHSSSTYEFPEEDLMTALIDNYFTHFNLYLPLLHRPTFLKAIRDGLHTIHDTFGGIVLLVCAIGARHSDDLRVAFEGVEHPEQSRGWKYFNQVQIVRTSLLDSPTLYDLQFYCLAIEFLQGTSASHSCWVLLGIALRLAQEVGVHKWRRKARPPTVENELWLRAFWGLVVMDRSLSSLFGRSCGIGNEELDLDLPLEVDDEYWEHPDPGQAFKQPHGKPSVVASFNLSLRLMNILGTTLRTLYIPQNTKTALGMIGEWEQPIVAQLDSKLNQWLDSLPAFLRWDARSTNDIFSRQSCHLHSQYYYVQIVVHKPFLRTSSPLALSSMSICANAARNCSNIIYIQSQKTPCSLIPMSVIAGFTSGIVLLLNLWSSERSGRFTNQGKDMSHVRKCMEVHRKCEESWPISGRIWDVLNELTRAGDLSSFGSSPLERRVDNHDPPVVSTSQPSSSSSITSMQVPLQSGADMNGDPCAVSDARLPMATQAYRMDIPARDAYAQPVSEFDDEYQQMITNLGTNLWPLSGPDTASNPSIHPSIPMPAIFGTDVVDMWMTTPSGFDLEGWDHYLANVNDITQSHHSSGSAQP